MNESTSSLVLMSQINAVRKAQAEVSGEFHFLSPPAAALIGFSALLKRADEEGYWQDEGEARELCIEGLALLAQFTRLTVMASVDKGQPISTPEFADILGIEPDLAVIELIATAIGMSPHWPVSGSKH